MSYYADADIEAANERFEQLLAGSTPVWQPATEPEDRALLMNHGRCPDCGAKYLTSHIPWQGGTCSRAQCPSYSPYQAAKCAICRSPRWQCSC